MGLFSGLPTALGNSLGALNTKVSEAASSVIASFGNAGPFKQLGAGQMSFTQSAAAVRNTAAAAAAALPNDPVAQLDEISRKAAQDAWTYNDISAQKAIADMEAAAGGNVAADEMESYKDDLGDEGDPTLDPDDHKVKLAGLGRDGSANQLVEIVFDVMPEVTENRGTDYEAIAPAQFIGAFQKFKGTRPTEWTIQATFVCRTSAEAFQNLMYLNQLRGWTMPFFGEETSKAYPKRLGAPPPVLQFSGWRKRMVGPVPVVITSLNWTFPQDVDYIPAIPDIVQQQVWGETGGADKPTPFPTVMKVSITLVESFSTTEFNNFNLQKFVDGDFEGAYGIETAVSENIFRASRLKTLPEPKQEQGFISRGATIRVPSTPSLNTDELQLPDIPTFSNPDLPTEINPDDVPSGNEEMETRYAAVEPTNISPQTITGTNVAPSGNADADALIAQAKAYDVPIKRAEDASLAAQRQADVLFADVTANPQRDTPEARAKIAELNKSAAEYMASADGMRGNQFALYDQADALKRSG